MRKLCKQIRTMDIASGILEVQFTPNDELVVTKEDVAQLHVSITALLVELQGHFHSQARRATKKGKKKAYDDASVRVAATQEIIDQDFDWLRDGGTPKKEAGDSNE